MRSHVRKTPRRLARWTARAICRGNPCSKSLECRLKLKPAPSSSSDDATIPATSGSWKVELINLDRIDHLTIDGNATFDPKTPNTVQTLVANKVAIEGQVSATTTATVEDGAHIEVYEP